MRKSLAVVFAVTVMAALVACSNSDGSDGGAASSTVKGSSSTEIGAGSTTTTRPPVGSTTVGGTAEAYAASLAIGLTGAEAGSGDLVVTKAEGACVAPAWIDTITVDRLVAEEVAPADLESPDFDFPSLNLTRAQGTSMVEAYVTCDVDIFEQFTDVLAEGLDATKTACLKGELTDDLARTFLAEALTSSDISASLSTTLDRIDQACKLSAG